MCKSDSQCYKLQNFKICCQNSLKIQLWINLFYKIHVLIERTGPRRGTFSLDLFGFRLKTLDS